MLDIIQERITGFEKKFELKVLFAIESGSRAWGFPSPDSDYDVRLVFVRPKSDYLTIGEKKETYVLPINDDLDIVGWDIRKFLRLLAKSNATPFEWLQSPMVYRDEFSLKNKMFGIAPAYYNAKSGVYHYRGLASKYFKSVTTSSEAPKLKSYFYIIRPLLAALYTNQFGTIPPLTLKDLLTVVDNKDALAAINELSEIKETASEDFRLHNRPFVLEKYLGEWIAGLDPDTIKVGANADNSQLDVLFQAALEL